MGFFNKYIRTPFLASIIALAASNSYAQSRTTITETFDSGEPSKSYYKEHTDKWAFKNSRLEAEEWGNTSGRSTFFFNDQLYDLRSNRMCLEVIIDGTDPAYSTDNRGLVFSGDPIGGTYYEFQFVNKIGEPAQFGVRRQSPGFNKTYFYLLEGGEDGNLPEGVIIKGGPNKLKICCDLQGEDFYINDTLIADDISGIPALSGYIGVMFLDSSNPSDPVHSATIKFDDYKIESDSQGGGGQDSLTPHIPDLFLRGDSNMDRRIDIADPIHVLNHLYANGSLDCPDAADANDDGRIDISDPIAILYNRFSDLLLPPPNISGKGMDLTNDLLQKCNGYGENPWENQ